MYSYDRQGDVEEGEHNGGVLGNVGGQGGGGDHLVRV